MNPDTLTASSKNAVTPVKGKTFSLFGNHPDTAPYYAEIGAFVDQLVRESGDPKQLLAMLQNKGYRTLALKKRDIGNRRRAILNRAESRFEVYLTDVEGHLKSLSLRHRFESALRTSRRQYFSHMIEIELVNRLNKESFKKCGYKLAFLPHCLHDLTKSCRATVRDDIDYMCARCSTVCFIRKASDLLESAHIRPFIWREANLRKLFRRLRQEGQHIGVLGMACLPELVNGMRLCEKAGVPVVGIPLNANRCARWMGAFYDNSVDLDALDALIR